MDKKSQAIPLIINKIQNLQKIWNDIPINDRHKYMYTTDENYYAISVKCGNTTKKMLITRNIITNYDTLKEHPPVWLSKSSIEIKHLESFPDSLLDNFFSN